MIDNKIMLAKEKLLKMYQKMYEIRAFEEKLYYLFLTEIMPGTIHQCIGQEAVAVGVCESLEKDDYITSTHRGHGHCIAKGMRMEEMMAEMYGKKTGCCRGMGGSMHLTDLEVGILGATGIVGAGIPIAVGAGLSIKLRRSHQVVACFFGEGAANQGAFHEGLNLASIWNLPVIFICENNLYAVSTYVAEAMKVKDVADRAAAYGIEDFATDGNDILTVYETVVKAVQKARTGGGPTLIECKTYRYKGHSRFDPAVYRSKEELAYWMQRDPISQLKNRLLEKGISSEQDLKGIEEKVEHHVNEAVKFAKESQEVRPEEILTYVYASSGEVESV